MTLKIAVSNQKGGVGKTTVSINVAGALAKMDKNVLLIDSDPQGHGTEGLGLSDYYDKDPPSIYDLLVDLKSGIRISDLIVEDNEFDVIPSNIDLFNAENQLTSAMRSRERLLMALNKLDKEYDFIIVDCPPSLGNLTDNALLACKNVLIPVQAEGTSIRALEILLDQVETLESAYGIDIEKLAVVANRVDVDKEADEMMEWFKATFKDSCPVFEIRKRVALKRAWGGGTSIFKHHEESDMEDNFLKIAKYLESVRDEQKEKSRKS